MKLKKFIKNAARKVLLEALATGDYKEFMAQVRQEVAEKIAKTPKEPEPPEKRLPEPESKPPENPAVKKAAKNKLDRLDPNAEKIIGDRPLKDPDKNLKLYKEREKIAVDRMDDLEAKYQQVLNNKTSTEQQITKAREYRDTEIKKIEKALDQWRIVLDIA